MSRTSTAFLLLALLLAGCASSPGDRAQRERARADYLYQTLTGMGLVRGESVDRVPSFRISGWDDIDDRTLVLTAGVRDRYLVELMATCPGLSTRTGIGLSSSTGSLTVSDSILVLGIGGSPQRCPIRAIWELEEIPGYDEAQPEDDG